MLHIIALIDDKVTENRTLAAEHGLSFYVEHNGRRILFDCGNGSEFLKNAKQLGVDLGNLDAVVLSHSHYDHAGGFRFLTEQGLGSGQVFTGPGFFEPKYVRGAAGFSDRSAGFDRKFLEANGIFHQEIRGVEEIFSGVYLVSGFPRVHSLEGIPERFVRKTAGGFVADRFEDEVCMALEVEGGLAVLVGCSHPGILNMISHLRSVLRKPVRAVFGGTHLVEADYARIRLTVDTLLDMGLEILGLSHCSGEAAECAIRSRSEIQDCYLGSGDSVFLN